jgi:hypothetical protein
MGALAAALPKSAASAALPTVRIRAASDRAFEFVPGWSARACGPNTHLTALAKGIEKTMLLSRMRNALMLIVATSLVLTGGGLLAYRTLAAERTEQTSEGTFEASVLPVPSDDPGKNRSQTSSDTTFTPKSFCDRKQQITKKSVVLSAGEEVGQAL